jgi:hypothetical protein
MIQRTDLMASGIGMLLTTLAPAPIENRSDTDTDVLDADDDQVEDDQVEEATVDPDGEQLENRRTGFEAEMEDFAAAEDLAQRRAELLNRGSILDDTQRSDPGPQRRPVYHDDPAAIWRWAQKIGTQVGATVHALKNRRGAVEAIAFRPGVSPEMRAAYLGAAGIRDRTPTSGLVDDLVHGRTKAEIRNRALLNRGEVRAELFHRIGEHDPFAPTNPEEEQARAWESKFDQMAREIIRRDGRTEVEAALLMKHYPPQLEAAFRRLFADDFDAACAQTAQHASGLLRGTVGF